MDYTTFKMHRDILESQFKEATAKLNVICDADPRGPFGLTSDRIKATPEYKQAHNVAEIAFQMLRNFNGKYAKTFKKEIAADIMKDRLAKLEKSN